MDRCVNDYVKKLSKEFGYKLKLGTLYKEDSGYFVAVRVEGTGVKNDILRIYATIKPMFFDDIFWEVFQMKENINEPLSLRAVGAFSVNGLQFIMKEKNIDIMERIPEYIRILLDECMNETTRLVDMLSDNFKTFMDYAGNVENKGMYDKALGEMLYHIYCGDYAAAYNIAADEVRDHRYGHFQNLGKDIYEHVIVYCRNHINQ